VQNARSVRSESAETGRGQRWELGSEIWRERRTVLTLRSAFETGGGGRGGGEDDAVGKSTAPPATGSWTAPPAAGFLNRSAATFMESSSLRRPWRSLGWKVWCVAVEGRAAGS
jgi:hypothetical protein